MEDDIQDSIKENNSNYQHDRKNNENEIASYYDNDNDNDNYKENANEIFNDDDNPKDNENNSEKGNNNENDNDIEKEKVNEKVNDNDNQNDNENDIKKDNVNKDDNVNQNENVNNKETSERIISNNKDIHIQIIEKIKFFICNTILSSSSLLFTCNHYLCTLCFSRRILLSKFSQLFPITTPLTFQCPCNAGNISLPLNKCLSLLSKPSQSNKKHCKKHSLLYKVYCPDCKLWLCDKCLIDFHNEFFMYHQTRERNLTARTSCPYHRGVYKDQYCKWCNKKLCMECNKNVNEHTNHPTYSFQQYKIIVQSKKSKLKFQTYEDIEMFLNEKLSKMLNKQNDKVDIVSRVIDESIQKLENVKKEFVLKCKENESKIKTLFGIVKKVYENYYKELNDDNLNFGSLEFIQNVKKELEDISYSSPNIDSFYQAVQKLPKIEGNVFDIKISFNKNIPIKHVKTFYASSPVTALCTLTNKEAFITGHLSGEITVHHNTSSNKSRYSIQEHYRPINTIKEITSLHNDAFISGSSDKQIKVFELQPQTSQNKLLIKCIYTFSHYHSSSIIDIIELNDKRIISSGSDNVLKIWNINHRNANDSYDSEEIELREGANYEKCLCEIDEDTIASGSGDNRIKIWSILQKSVKKFLIGHSSYISTLLPFGKTKLISGGGDGLIIVWNLLEQKKMYHYGHKKLKGHCGVVQGIVFVNQCQIVSCSNDKSVRIWDLDELKCLFCLNKCHESAIYGIGVIDEKTVVTGGNDRKINYYKLNENGNDDNKDNYDDEEFDNDEEYENEDNWEKYDDEDEY